MDTSIKNKISKPFIKKRKKIFKQNLSTTSENSQGQWLNCVIFCFWRGNFRILQKQIRSPKLHKNLSFKETTIQNGYNYSSFFYHKKCLKLLNKWKHCTTFLNIWSTIFFSDFKNSFFKNKKRLTLVLI